MKLSYLCMTGYDGPQPDIDIFPVPPRLCDRQIAHESMNRWLGMTELVDQLGFDWVSIAEHHYAAYQLTPNPMIMAAAISQRTKNVRIAMLGPLVPLNNPVRLAEEIAMLDTLTGGRMEVMFLRGTPNEHKTYDTPADKTRGMTLEGIDLILKAWQEESPFSWHGENYNFSNIGVWPRVQQLPHPPVFTSGNSEPSIKFAASRRLGIGFSFAQVEDVRHWVALYRDECAKAGWTPTPQHVVYRGIAYAAESDAAAVAGVEGHFGRKMKEAEEMAYLAQKTLGGPPQIPLVLSPYFVGGPETLIDKFNTLRECGVGVVDMAFVIGTPEQQRQSVETFAATVMPTVKSWDSTHFADEVATAAE